LIVLGETPTPYTVFGFLLVLTGFSILKRRALVDEFRPYLERVTGSDQQ
jgi:drug/metabolite transporter (DMT)-like permease